MKAKTYYLFAAFLLGFGMQAQTDLQTTVEVHSEITQTLEEPVYRDVDVLASYRGGYEVLLKRIETATKNCKSGKMKSKNKNAQVVAEVLISKTGEVSDAVIIKSEADFCDRDIVMSLKTSHQWVPARINNKPVNSYLQIRINLQNSYR